MLPPEKLGDLITDYNQAGDQLREQITDICYFMNGGIEFNSAYGMSFIDREIAVNVINRRLKEQHPGGKEYM
jgi:hypothetical protein